MEKKSVLFAGVILAVSLVICSYVLKGSNLLSSVIPVQPSSTFSVPNNFNIAQNDTMLIYDASAYLGMNDADLKNAILGNELPGIPYMKIGENYIFSRKLLDGWIQDNIKKNSQYEVTEVQARTEITVN